MSMTTERHRELGTRLTGLLERLIAEHDELLELTHEHAGALRRADGAAIDDCVRRRAGIIARIGELNDERAALLLAYPKGATLTQVAESLGGEGDAVRDRGAQLRSRVLEVRKHQSHVRMATERLLTHMRGITSQVHRALGEARTYSDRGRIALGPAAAPALDLTS